MRFLFPNNWMSETEGGILAGLAERLPQAKGLTLLGSISQIDRLTTDEGLILYDWDQYSWIERSSGPYKRWGELCEKSIDIWFASEAVKARTKEFYGVDKGTVIKTFCPLGTVEDIRDTDTNGFIVCPVRHYLQDECFDWARLACYDLGLPFLHPDHNLSNEEYKRYLARAKLIVSHYSEASTGGLGMIEGYWLGKDVLASGSPYNGAVEYMGSRATYFDPQDGYENFKVVLNRAVIRAGHSSPYTLEQRRAWVKQNYGIDRMVREIGDRLKQILV